MEILNARVKKFWFFVQLQSSSTSALSAVASPLTDHPFQRLELLVMRRDDFFGFVGHAVEQPFSISLYVDRRVLDLLRLCIRSQQLGCAMFDGNVGRNELDRLHVHFQLELRLLLEAEP